MRTTGLCFLAACVNAPAVISAQAPKEATYITDEEVKKVNTQSGTDRTIRVVDIGNENFAVGVIHRGASGGGARGTGAGGGAAAGGGGAGAGAGAGGGAARGAGAGAGGGAARGGAAQSAGPCGEQMTPAPTSGTPGGIAHDSQTEGYYIISGGG